MYNIGEALLAASTKPKEIVKTSLQLVDNILNTSAKTLVENTINSLKISTDDHTIALFAELRILDLLTSGVSSKYNEPLQKQMAIVNGLVDQRAKLPNQPPAAQIPSVNVAANQTPPRPVLASPAAQSAVSTPQSEPPQVVRAEQVAGPKNSAEERKRAELDRELKSANRLILRKPTDPMGHLEKSEILVKLQRYEEALT